MAADATKKKLDRGVVDTLKTIEQARHKLANVMMTMRSLEAYCEVLEIPLTMEDDDE